MRAFRFIVCVMVVAAAAAFGPSRLPSAVSPAVKAAEGYHRSADDRSGAFVLDVAMDGPTWRNNDGSNPFYPLFTGALSRGLTFIVSGKIYRGFTLHDGGDFNASGNPTGPETAGAIGTWVCRGAFNLDFSQIVAGEAPHVTSTQVFTFDGGHTIVSEGPEGGATVRRALIGGTGRYRNAGGEVSETPIGVNTSGLFNVRFRFDVD